MEKGWVDESLLACFCGAGEDCGSMSTEMRVTVDSKLSRGPTFPDVHTLYCVDLRHYRAVRRERAYLSDPGEFRMVPSGLCCNVCYCAQVECVACNLLPE